MDKQKISRSQNSQEDKTEHKEKIILPENLQREMIKFFLKTSIPKLAAQEREKEHQQKPPISNKKAVEEID